MLYACFFPAVDRPDIDTALGKGPAKKQQQQHPAKRVKLDLPKIMAEETDEDDSDADAALLEPTATGVRVLMAHGPLRCADLSMHASSK